MALSLISASLLLIASLSSHVSAVELIYHKEGHTDGCIHLPVVHSTNVNHFSSKRGVQLQLANRSDIAYYAQLSIGTPPQPVFVQLDTGSFELWVNPDCTAVSGPDRAFCERVGQFDTSKSSTASSLGTGKTLRYGIGRANITYFEDTISLAGSTTALQNVQFGVATSSEDTFSGILGIGYGKGIATKYPNFVDELATQNATKVKMYTLALGTKEEKEGVIVFGGVDTSKFAGPLAKLPIVPAENSPDGVPRFWVNMNSISMTPPNNVTRIYEDSKMPVFLDSGSTMTLLPKNLTATIAKDFGAEAPDDNGFYRIDCGLTEMNGTIDFAFDGLNIRVPYKEMIREVPSNPPACFLGITPSDTFTLLGDTFLRSAYVVFDLETDSIWMTQAANCGSTPAALKRVEDLAEVVGACGLTATAVTSVVTTSSTGSGSDETTTTGLAVPTTSGSASSTNGSGVGSASRPLPTSLGSRSFASEGLVWTVWAVVVGMMFASLV
ncbi:putative aspartic-type endopeptidase [Cladorrhinum sp. PSN332]|nr:putative aspartic-type endopeptidase [Cladorrhinum sp. PSN332]